MTSRIEGTLQQARLTAQSGAQRTGDYLRSLQVEASDRLKRSMDEHANPFGQAVANAVTQLATGKKQQEIWDELGAQFRGGVVRVARNARDALGQVTLSRANEVSETLARPSAVADMVQRPNYGRDSDGLIQGTLQRIRMRVTGDGTQTAQSLMQASMNEDPESSVQMPISRSSGVEEPGTAEEQSESTAISDESAASMLGGSVQSESGAGDEAGEASEMLAFI